MPLPSPVPDGCLIYLVRHGATASNLASPPQLQGRRVDDSLSLDGVLQARLTGELLAEIPLAAVYSSPLRRARETAIAIAERHRLQVQQVEDLQEADVGRWERRSWHEIANSEPVEHLRFLESPAEHGYAGGENLSQVLQRVRPVVERLGGSHLGGCIAVVAHNVVNRALLAHVLGLSLNQYRLINQDNGGVSILRWRDGRLKLLTLNSTFHLP